MSKESGGRVGRKEMDEWARSNLDVMEDASGQTSVKDLQYIEVRPTTCCCPHTSQEHMGGMPADKAGAARGADRL